MDEQTILRHYARYYRPRNQAHLHWFRSQPTLEAAIEKAALSEDERGKRYSHQRRIKRDALQKAVRMLSLARADIARCKNFQELFDLVENTLVPIVGVGELYTYDVALRIGAKLGLLPARIYLHAGSRSGAKALGLAAGKRSLDMSEVPPFLREIPPHEVEDVLCIYKAELQSSTAENPGRLRRPCQ